LVIPAKAGIQSHAKVGALAARVVATLPKRPAGAGEA
jgi:hypothetical protein